MVRKLVFVNELKLECFLFFDMTSGISESELGFK